MLQKILIATGDSPESAEVFKSGLTLAEKYGAQISILHVLNLFHLQSTRMISEQHDTDACDSQMKVF